MIFCRFYFKDLIYEIRKRTLLYVLVILRASFLLLFYSSILPLGFRQPQHVPKNIHGSSSTTPETTEVIYGVDNIINKTVKALSKVRSCVIGCWDRAG